MEFILSIFFQAFYITLEELILAANIFVIIQGYIIIKRQSKKSKKRVL